jgi:hypothetical protein
MISRFAVPFVIVAALFLPLPFVLAWIVFGVILAVWPRGEPGLAGAPSARRGGPALLRSPPR